MFTLYTIKDIVVIIPSELHGDSAVVLLKHLQDKYLFKVKRVLENKKRYLRMRDYALKSSILK
jgi:DNA-directed RNA polymerase subunit E'/Rpb7